MPTSHKIRWILLGIIAILFIVLVGQNTGTTSIRFLGWETEASRIILFPGFALAGFAAGALTVLLLQRRKHHRQREAREEQSPAPPSGHQDGSPG